MRSGDEQLLLPLELLQDVGLEVGARRDVGDLEQREQRRVMVGRAALRGEVLRAREQILEPHQRADALVQRMLVADHGGRAASVQGVILPNGAAFCPKTAPRVAACRAASAR